MIYRLLLLTFLLLGIQGNTNSQDVYQLLKKSEDNMKGASNHAIVKMSIIREDWTREITMESWSKGQDFSLILITGPARDKGTAFLKRNKEIWNWQPTINKVIKLPSSMMGQSWMGSDFSNDDLVEESSVLTDYTHKILRTESYEGSECHVIELIPKEESAVVWGKIIMWMDVESLVQRKIESYDEDLMLVNTLKASNMEKLGSRTIAKKLEIIPEENEGKTVIEYIDMEFDVSFKSNFFSLQHLKRL